MICQHIIHVSSNTCLLNAQLAEKISCRRKFLKKHCNNIHNVKNAAIWITIPLQKNRPHSGSLLKKHRKSKMKHMCAAWWWCDIQTKIMYSTQQGSWKNLQNDQSGLRRALIGLFSHQWQCIIMRAGPTYLADVINVQVTLWIILMILLFTVCKVNANLEGNSRGHASLAKSQYWHR